MAAQTYYLRFKDGSVTSVASVVSETFEDKTIYDTTNYRDELDAAFLGRAIAATTTAPFASGNPPEGASDSINHTAPRNEAKKRSRICLWSGSSGSGDLLGWAWTDELRGVSTSTFTRV